MPESFKVLVKELQRLGLAIEVISEEEELPSAEEATEAPEAVEEGSAKGEVKEELPSAEETAEVPAAVEEDLTERGIEENA